MSRYPEQPCCSPQVFIDRLPRPVEPIVIASLKCPHLASLPYKPVKQMPGQSYAPGLAGLELAHRYTLRELRRPQIQNVTNPQTRAGADFQCQSIWRRECRQ